MLKLKLLKIKLIKNQFGHHNLHIIKRIGQQKRSGEMRLSALVQKQWEQWGIGFGECSDRRWVHGWGAGRGLEHGLGCGG